MEEIQIANGAIDPPAEMLSVEYIYISKEEYDKLFEVNQANLKEKEP